MAKIGLFYGSTTGNTVKVAEMIQKAFGPGVVDLLDVGVVSSQDLKKYDTLILGTSTWHWGGLQDEWALFEDFLTSDILKGKKVAFFGLGDQKRYPDHFADGMGLLYEKVKPLGVQVVGVWPREGYDFTGLGRRTWGPSGRAGRGRGQRDPARRRIASTSGSGNSSRNSGSNDHRLITPGGRVPQVRERMPSSRGPTRRRGRIQSSYRSRPSVR